MAKTKSKKRSFTAYVRVNLEVGYDLTADNFEQALEQAKALKVEDVVEMHGEHCDSEIALGGLYVSGLWCREGLK